MGAPHRLSNGRSFVHGLESEASHQGRDERSDEAVVIDDECTGHHDPDPIVGANNRARLSPILAPDGTTTGAHATSPDDGGTYPQNHALLRSSADRTPNP
jgi:hypothetical protein